MPSESAADNPTFQRLHPVSLLFSLGSVLRRFLIPGLIVLFFGRGERTEIWAMVLAVPALAYAAAIFLSLRYAFGREELIIKSGILSRTERHIPYERIQNVDMTRTVVHRLLGVADVVIQTASGTEAEATLRVLSVAAAERVRERLFHERHRSTTAAAPPAAAPTKSEATSDHPQAEPVARPIASGHLLRRVPLADLIVLGIISNRGMVALAAVLAITVQLDLLPSWERTQAALEPVTGWITWSRLSSFVAGALLLLAAIVGLRLLSILWAIATFFGFTLTRDRDELRTRFGLLTQRTLTIPRHRIQLLDVHGGLLHRLFGVVTLRARTAGAVRQDSAAASLDALLPIVRRSELGRLLPEIQTELGDTPAEWRPVHPRAVRRAFLVRVLWLAGPLIVASSLYYPWGFLAWIAVPAAYLLAQQYVRHLGYAVTDEAIWYRWGWLSQRCRMVRISKIQAAFLRESPFDRRHGMASLVLDTANAGGIGTAAVRIPYLPRHEGQRLYANLSAAAAGTEFRW